MLNFALKAACVAIYALALASMAGALPAGTLGWAPAVAAALLIIHALELVFAFRHVRSYRAALAISVLLTLLFGLLHWKPLADNEARA